MFFEMGESMNSELLSIYSLIGRYKVEAMILLILAVAIIVYAINRIREKKCDDNYAKYKSSQSEESLDKIIDTNKQHEVNNADSIAVNNEIDAFTSDDVKVLGIHRNMTDEEVKKLFGEPINQQGGYPFGAITFSEIEGFDTTDTEVFIDKPNIEAPRGIKVGDDADFVLLKFPSIDQEEDFETDLEKILYEIVKNDEIFTGKVYYDYDNEYIESISFSHISDALWYLELYITENIVTSIKYGYSSVDIKTVKEVLY